MSRKRRSRSIDPSELRSSVTKAELEECLADDLTEVQAYHRLKAKVKTLRKYESRYQVYLKTFPEFLKTIPYDVVIPLRADDLMTSREIGEKLGMDPPIVANAIGGYYFKWDDKDKQKAYASRIAKEHNRLYREDHDGRSPFEIDSIRMKAEQTHMDKYGSRSPFASSAVRDKARKTMNDRYGVDNCMNNPEIWEKARKSMVSRYGVPYTLQSETLKDQMQKTMIERYGVDNCSNIPGESDLKREHYFAKHGVYHQAQNPEVREKMDRTLKKAGREGSQQERNLKEWLDHDLGMIEGEDYIWHDQRRIQCELDFYFTKIHKAVELSPAFCHHSNVTKSVLNPKKTTYHINKRRKCDEAGIELITLFDWMLDDKKMDALTKPFLKMKLTGHADRTLYGRNVTISKAKSNSRRKACIRFTAANHFKGSVASKWWYEVDDGDGNMVGSFSLSPAKDGNALELKRVCWASGVQVRYGLSKIIKRIARDFPDYDRLVSYSDCDMGNGSSYGKAGFTADGETKAGLHFVNIRHPKDTYSWSVATTWSAKSGVIASKLGSMDVTNSEARVIVETVLPHRADGGCGYMALYDTGNRKWILDLDKLR